VGAESPEASLTGEWKSCETTKREETTPPVWKLVGDTLAIIPVNLIWAYTVREESVVLSKLKRRQLSKHCLFNIFVYNSSFKVILDRLRDRSCLCGTVQLESFTTELIGGVFWQTDAKD